MKQFVLSILIILFNYSCCMASDKDDYTREFYNNTLTYIKMTSSMDSVVIYEEDKQYRHFIPLIYRGKFKLTKIQNYFYSVRSDFPGKACIDNMHIFHETYESETLTVRINLNNTYNRYIITACGIGSGKNYKYIYNEKLTMSLPIDKEGYLFSIAPMDYYFGAFMTGISDGFTNTIKFLNLPLMEKDLFQSGGIIEISLPMFNDNIFTEWCIDGDIMFFKNNKIIFHGQEFNIYRYKYYN